MPLILVLVIVLAVVGALGGYLILGAIPFAMAEPAHVETKRRPVPASPTEDALVRLGFTPVGWMEFPSAQKDAPPFWQSAFCGADRTTLAIFGTFNGREQGAFTTTWPEGGVVVSRWPKLRLMRERRVSGGIATVSATVADAYARHRREVPAFGTGRGAPVPVEDMSTAQDCLRIGGATFKILIGRAYKVIIPLSLIGFGAVVAAALR